MNPLSHSLDAFLLITWRETTHKQSYLIVFMKCQASTNVLVLMTCQASTNILVFMKFKALTDALVFVNELGVSAANGALRSACALFFGECMRDRITLVLFTNNSETIVMDVFMNTDR